jgi:Cu(I)/Ag(I) efflux system protein CusF
MKNSIFTTTATLAIALLASPAFAADFTIKESGVAFQPSSLTIQPGDTVTFVNGENKKHDVMFVNVPKGVDEMIMSQMMSKEGEKFSYKFTVPGTYQFHCHPHEELGMKGTLIVGAPSKPGTTVAMDHHKMGISAEKGAPAKVAPATGPGTPAGPQATGTVNSVDAAGHTLNITHDPIKALGWPTMKMLFTVDAGVDLGTVNAGDKVGFTLKASGDDYTISEVHKQ